jgi:hypothetical protein
MINDRILRVAMFTLAFALIMISAELALEMQSIKRMKRITVYVREAPPVSPGEASLDVLEALDA